MKRTIVSLMLFVLMTPAIAFAQQTPDIPKVEYRGGIYYLVLDGETPYARGYQHGKALSFPINLALRNFKEWLRANANIKEPEKDDPGIC